ncbi:MAG: 1-deoxy-D-xylulose-5-phosphate reductoisomerase [Ilumatobacteraceae bacterium]|nr:1-deoxy-D-xylulose-5-phosphate reductoisomerase [Ilumatobacteraceae bacterium]
MTIVGVSIAGSSGSIGRQTLEVIFAENAKSRSENTGVDYVVHGLGVGSSIDVLIEQAKIFSPRVVAVADESLHHQVRDALPNVRVVRDMEDLVDGADVVVNGVVGFAGLAVTLETLRQGKRLALANKESLIAAGPVVQPLRAVRGAEIIPVDSEHCAIHQCLRSTVRPDVEVARLVLTASGGPFRGRSKQDLADVTVDQALAHPTWSMGPKITIDSSTLMNKGLEVIEAHELFGVDYSRIEVVVHPQSIVHSMVEFSDGSTIAQLSLPDMRLPIGYALAHPHRALTAFGRIDWSALSRLDFEEPDLETFRCLTLAYQAGRAGGTAPAFLSAANEVAVEAFLAGLLKWPDIAAVVESSMQAYEATDGTLTSSEIIEADRVGRETARKVLLV